MNTQKIFIGDKKEATITCLKCGKTRLFNVEKIGNIRQPVRVKCNCGNAFIVLFETRAHYRKTTNIMGYYSRPEPRGERGKMVVENVSKTGLGIRVMGKHSIRAGDSLVVEFFLDNAKKSLIRTEVIVRHVSDMYLGVQFSNLEEYVKKELGFYLMP